MKAYRMTGWAQKGNRPAVEIYCVQLEDNMEAAIQTVLEREKRKYDKVKVNAQEI